MTPFYDRLPQVAIPGTGIIADADSAGKKILGVAAAAVGIHAAVGIGKSIKNRKKDK
jgi:hydrogenase small subunit/[NiFe] hydrogenase small subunit